MQGARRRPYVDMVEEGNAADDRPGRNPKGRGAAHPHGGGCASPLGQIKERRHECLLRGAFLRRERLQYRHIAADSPPRTASHIAFVAHVPAIEIGSDHRGPPVFPRGPPVARTRPEKRDSSGKLSRAILIYSKEEKIWML